MHRYAENTTVPIGRSRVQIDTLLHDWGASALQWSDDFATGRVILRFVWPYKELRYCARFDFRLPTRDELAKRALDQRNGMLSERKLKRLLDQRGKMEHRLLLLWLKAALNAVEAGLVRPEVIFLPFLEGKDGQTVAEAAIPRLTNLLAGGAERLLTAGGSRP